MRTFMFWRKFGNVISFVIVFARKFSRCLCFVPAEVASCCIGKILGLFF